MRFLRRNAYGVSVLATVLLGRYDNYLTTTKGFWAGIHTTETVVPLPGYQTGTDNQLIGTSAFVAKVFTTPGPNRIPLKLWYNVTRHNHMTTTNSVIPPCGRLERCDTWELKGDIGYVYANASDVPAPLTPVGLRTWTKGRDRVLVRDGLTLPSPWTPLTTLEGYGFTY